MSTETELRRRRTVAPPELDVEEEVDLGRYAERVAARWWLPVLGLVLGIALGYLLAQGAGKVYRAEALLYLGQPFSPNGNAPVQSLATNPNSVGRIVRSEAALRAAASASGMRVGKLRGKVSTKAISAGRGAVRAGQSQLVEVSVKGDAAREVETAANALATHVVDRLSGYVNVKITAFERRIASQKQALASLERRTDLLSRAITRAQGLTSLDLLVLVSQADNAEQRRAQLLDEQAETEQLLSLARDVERAQVVEEAVARETTARSVRSSVLVGAALGLLLGALAALVWDAVLARTGRTPAA